MAEMSTLVINTEIKNYILTILLGDDKCMNLVSYAEYKNQKALIVIKPSDFFEKNIYGKKESIPQLPLSEWEGIPLLFGTRQTERVDGQLILYADLIASSYFLMSRYEELIQDSNRDEHNRFMGKGSLTGKAGIINRAIIDEYGKKLRESLRMMGAKIEEPSNKGKIYLTHDVDIPWQKMSFRLACKYIVKDLIKHRRLHIYPLLNCFNCYLLNPHDTFDWLLEQDRIVKKHLGDRCEDIYFIISNLDTSNKTGNYIEDKKANKLLSNLDNRSAHLGLHLSYEAGRDNNFEKILLEKETLENKVGRKIFYNRNHYLLSRDPGSFRNLIKAGITDDFTMGYADAVGFRLGTSQCVRWIDPERIELTELRLHSLNIMDNTLCEKQYLGLDAKKAFEKIEEILKNVKVADGDFCILFHNSLLKTGEYQWLKLLYQKVVAMLSE